MNVLVFVNNAVINTGIQISLQNSAFDFLGVIPRSGIARSHANYIFNFLVEYHTDSHSDSTTLHLYLWYAVRMVCKGANFSQE
jgi:hypothetical protein